VFDFAPEFSEFFGWKFLYHLSICRKNSRGFLKFLVEWKVPMLFHVWMGIAYTVPLTYQQVHQELEELKNQRNIEVMRTCDVIGMTVTGATIRANLLGNYVTSNLKMWLSLLIVPIPLNISYWNLLYHVDLNQ